MVEWQPYPKLPGYAVCPMDGEGCSHSLHRNFLLPIRHNLGQDECGNAVEGDGSDKPAPVSHEDTLPAYSPTEIQPESTPCTLPK